MDADRRIAALATAQHGVVHLRQAIDAGLTRRAIQHRIAVGRWEHVHREVVRISGAPDTGRQQLMAAVLGCPGSVVARQSAGRLAGFTHLPADDGWPHVLRTHGSNHQLHRVHVHQTRWLPDHHRTVIDGIPVTTPERTVFDLAAELRPQRFRRLVDELLAASQVDLTRLERVHAELARRGRTGSRLMGVVLDERQGGYVPPASELEARFVALCQRRGLPVAERQLRAPWAEDAGRASPRVDMAFPGARVLVELDSWRHHSSMAAFEGDRRRDQLAAAAGWRTLRFTWRQLTADPDHVVAVLRAVLERPGHF